MTGPEHYVEAERWLDRGILTGQAVAHAVLALTAAVAVASDLGWDVVTRPVWGGGES